MSIVEIFAICDAESIGPGWIMPFTLARNGADGPEPFPIIIARDNKNGYFAFVNSCPHEPHTLYDAPMHIPDAAFLVCEKHGAKFEFETGLCTEGPCQGARLASIPATVLDGEVCLGGIELMEEDEDNPPEIMITAD
jgi:nitrite reductase/ring-hydroxylating ferredoxin subunit